jgi:hypothetical protein
MLFEDSDKSLSGMDHSRTANGLPDYENASPRRFQIGLVKVSEGRHLAYECQLRTISICFGPAGNVFIEKPNPRRFVGRH